jgi:hypothetical protein
MVALGLGVARSHIPSNRPFPNKTQGKRRGRLWLLACPAANLSHIVRNTSRNPLLEGVNEQTKPMTNTIRNLILAGTWGLGAIASVGDGYCEITIDATSGVIAAPFAVSGGCVSQPFGTDITNGGRAAYTFTITNAGDYVLQAEVEARASGQNSLLLNIDGEPQDPLMMWEVPIGEGFANRVVCWGAAGGAQTNKVWQLASGPHQLIVRGRGANTRFRSFSFGRLPPSPQSLRVVGAWGIRN